MIVKDNKIYSLIKNLNEKKLFRYLNFLSYIKIKHVQKN
jgi:hypothetical protein